MTVHSAKGGEVLPEAKLEKGEKAGAEIPSDNKIDRCQLLIEASSAKPEKQKSAARADSSSAPSKSQLEPRNSPHSLIQFLESIEYPQRHELKRILTEP